MRILRLGAVSVLAMFVASCGSSGSSSPTGAGPTDDAGADSGDEPTFGGDRPVTLHVPPAYVAGVPAPLVILLHGYGASGALEDLYLGLTAVSDARGFLYARPDGTVDAAGKRFWNATDGCCNFDNASVDDSTYVSSLITQIKARYAVDPKRVFLIGHSNGGFMSYRMACDHPDQIAAIASLAGAMWTDATKCTPGKPVAILQIHGTADATVGYGGGQIQGRTFPSAETTVNDWVTLNGCSATGDTTAPALDLDTKLAGAETKVTKYTGCKPGGHAELWAIQGGAHIPSVAPTFSANVIDFLYAHPKP